MATRYFVSATRHSGMIGSMTESEIRAGLESGSLQSTFFCMATEPADDPDRPWCPLWVLFDLPKPEGAEVVPFPKPAESDIATPPRSGPTVDDRITNLEQKIAQLQRPESEESGCGFLLLTFGQIVSLLGCLSAPIYTLFAFSQMAAVRERAPNAPDVSLWIIVGAAVAFAYSAAMLVVFSRVKRIPTE